MVVDLPRAKNGLLEGIHGHGVGEELGLQTDPVPGVIDPAALPDALYIVPGIELDPGQIRFQGHGDAGLLAAKGRNASRAQHEVVVVASAAAQLFLGQVDVPAHGLFQGKIKGCT